MDNKILKVNDDVYKSIINYAKQENISVNELLKSMIEEKN